jgi:S-(hydroxymethyl)glutathione dehydrogenase/alcohol dehydrogenase
VPLVQSKAQPWTRIITHRLPLSDGVRGYQLFDTKAEGCIKVVLDCSAAAAAGQWAARA